MSGLCIDIAGPHKCWSQIGQLRDLFGGLSVA